METHPTVYIPNRIDDEALAALREFSSVIYHPHDFSQTEDEIEDAFSKANAVICYPHFSILKKYLDAARDLKVVSNIAVGYDNLPLSDLTDRNVFATNTPDVLTETTADLAFALLMAAARRVVEADSYLRSGLWEGWRPDLLLGKDVYGATLGIVGMGRIGQAVARRARGFNMKVLYTARTPKEEFDEEYGTVFTPLADLLPEADFVLLLTPLSEETKHLIGRDAMKRMKSDAILINAARGPVVDEQALVAALKAGEIAGAGLDVYDQEPILKDHPLIALKNVVLLPHIGSATGTTRRAMAMMAVENVRCALHGKTPPQVLNPEVRQ